MVMVLNADGRLQMLESSPIVQQHVQKKHDEANKQNKSPREPQCKIDTCQWGFGAPGGSSSNRRVPERRGVYLLSLPDFENGTPRFCVVICN